MFLALKIIGSFCAVAVPASVCGTQAFLTKKEQTNFKKQIEIEIQKTSDSLASAKTNYQKEITRIQQEKNELATTKKELTYNPVDITTKINELKKAKSTYESKHKETQQAITEEITKHDTAVKKAKTDIEELWTNEKTRVENIQTTLDTNINNARTNNSNLRESIETLKTTIDNQINNIFNPTP